MFHLFVVLLFVWLLVAYLVLPALWRRHDKRHPAIEGAPTITLTANGIHGDPLNIALVGSETEVQQGMLAAGWFPADAITLRSSLHIATAIVMRHEYADAPVSNLFLFGRKQDLAFEQPVGKSPSQRHHVRFWKSAQVDEEQNPLWFGAATFDSKSGFSHTTAQITHHISPEVDPERDRIISGLQEAGFLTDVNWIDGFQPQLTGKNGGGDPYHTDGRLAVGILKSQTDYSPAVVPGASEGPESIGSE
ncbi:MAG: LssY C-terminal domain-containing protein [Planctomycetota bacterium]|nr:LssY C-terminal domain-containing protein [Planctomycetota bacterium]